MRNCNINQIYIDKVDAWLGILAAAEFAFCSTTNRLKGYSQVQLLFVHDIVLPIKHTVDWELIRQKN